MPLYVETYPHNPNEEKNIRKEYENSRYFIDPIQLILSKYDAWYVHIPVWSCSSYLHENPQQLFNYIGTYTYMVFYVAPGMYKNNINITYFSVSELASNFHQC